MLKIILTNGNITPGLNYGKKSSIEFNKYLTRLAEIKKVSLYDLKSFLAQDHTSFSVLSVSLKSILSTGRTTVTLSKNSAKSFYLKEPNAEPIKNFEPVKKSNPQDDCLTDAQNCDFFRFFNSKEQKLRTRFLDKAEANFEGTATEPLLFLTLTFNTTQNDLKSWTTNWNPTDACWNRLGKKQAWLRPWAQNFDPNAEPMIILLQKISQHEASNFTTASNYLSKFLRSIRLKWKPQNWKWVVVAELQKNGNWHFHLLSTPIAPYTHKCVLDKTFKPCWNCCAYISELWPWGRVNSQSPADKPISKYLAKYLAKSFHLRSLYREHGFQENNKAYRFFKNLYSYEERQALLNGKSKFDQLTGEYLAPNQKIFRQADNSYHYRTNEQIVGQATKPLRLSKNFRLGNSLNTQKLLNLAHKHSKKELISLKKPSSLLTNDFQIFLITNLLLMSKKAEFLTCPFEQTKVPKNTNCDQSSLTHFQSKQIFQFTFFADNSQLIQQFLKNLDTYALDYGLAEAKEFQDNRFTDPIESRNAYLNRWAINVNEYRN